MESHACRATWSHLKTISKRSRNFSWFPTPGACIHVPPPPPNQIVHVIMEGNKKAQVRLWMEAVWVEGTLRLAEATTREGALSFFQLTGTLIQSYKEGK